MDEIKSNFMNIHKAHFKRLQVPVSNGSSIDHDCGDLRLVFSHSVFSYKKILFYLICTDPCIKMLLSSRDKVCECSTTIVFQDLSAAEFEDKYLNFMNCKTIVFEEDDKHDNNNEEREDNVTEDRISNQHKHLSVSNESKYSIFCDKKVVDDGASYDSIVCDQCGMLFKQAKQLKRHCYEKHSKRKPVECKTCGIQFDHQYSLNKHLFKHLSVNLYICDICEVTFKRKSDLHQHKTSFHVKKKAEFKCSECNANFSSQKTLNKHKKTVHFNVKFFCEECGDSFSRKDNLKRHYKVHSSH